jgi:phosphatidylserine synthase
MCKFIAEPFIEVFKTSYTFYKTFNKGDKKIEDLIEQTRTQYLEKGWDMTTGVWLIIIFANFIFIQLTSDNTKLLKRCTIIVIVVSSFLFLSKLLCRKYKKITKYIFSVFIVFIGMLITVAFYILRISF